MYRQSGYTLKSLCCFNILPASVSCIRQCLNSAMIVSLCLIDKVPFLLWKSVRSSISTIYISVITHKRYTFFQLNEKMLVEYLMWSFVVSHNTENFTQFLICVHPLETSWKFLLGYVWTINTLELVTMHFTHTCRACLYWNVITSCFVWLANSETCCST